MRGWALLLVTLVTPGCVGWIQYTQEEYTITDARIDLTKTRLSPDGVETLRYDRGMGWTGIWLIPIVPVPIPLLLPVARDDVEFEFRDGGFVQAHVHEIEVRERLCGVGVMRHAYTGPELFACNFD